MGKFTRIIGVLFFTCFFYACKKAPPNLTLKSSHFLEFQLSNNRTFLYDHDIEEGVFLFVNWEDERIEEFDKNGELSKFVYLSHYKVERIKSLSYLKNNGIIIYTTGRLVRSQPDWEKFDETELSLEYEPYERLSNNVLMASDSEIYFPQVGDIPNFKYSKHYFDSSSILGLYNVNTNHIQKELNIPKLASFYNPNRLLLALTPIATVSKSDVDCLIFSLPGKFELYNYCLTKKKFEKTKLSSKYFIPAKGIDFKSQSQNYHSGFGSNNDLYIDYNISSRVLNLVSLTNQTLVFFSGNSNLSVDKTSLSQSLKIREELPVYLHSTFFKQTVKTDFRLEQIASIKANSDTTFLIRSLENPKKYKIYNLRREN